MSGRTTIELDTPLVGDVDLPAVLAEIPRGHTLKGMFFRRYAAEAGADWPDVARELRRPPPDGRYHAFEDYPLSDYLRIFDRAARRRFPGSTREAYRLLARGEVEVFTESTLGKVTFTLLRDPAAALLRSPEVFEVLARGPAASARRSGERSVLVTFSRYDGALEYAIGVLEGLVLAFDESPRLVVTVTPERRVDLDVSW